MLAIFSENGEFCIEEADDVLLREIDSMQTDLVGGALDVACGNNGLCGSIVNTFCIAPNVSCSTGGPNNTGCPNVVCEISVT